ncbi:MAG: metal-sensitive transcriptional regulator [Actinobacteria bacterium]|nr:metal-sensitive transcriptional regulator [Actinomycetota bacterium]
MIDGKIIKKLEPRIKRIEGQIRGIMKMVDKKKYCIDILQQISATQGALKSVASIILKNHINTCVKEAIESKKDMEIKEKVNEVIEMYEKFIK